MTDRIRDERHRAGRRQPIGVAVMLAILLLLTLPAAVADTQVSQQLTTQPAAFDQFLSIVNRATPRDARIMLVEGYTDPQYHMLTRCEYVLYPRAVVTYTVSARRFQAGRLTTSWSQLLRAARHKRAGYVLLWSLPPATNGRPIQEQDPWGWALPSGPRGAPPAGAAHDGWGTLARVRL